MLRVARSLRRGPERMLHPLRRSAARRRLTRRPLPRSVLVVCHGNICRSPYAAALLRRTLPPVVQVASAGFVGSGRPCPQAAVDAAKVCGLDLSGHRSQLLTPRDVANADLIVVMDAAQRSALHVLFGRDRGDVLVLGDLDPQPIDTREIEDPMDRSRAVFERSYSRIARCVRELGEAVAIGVRGALSGDVAPQGRRQMTT